ncbi:MAG: hypothetical protein ABI591_09900 [Kofleriaceae bacterium]
MRKFGIAIAITVSVLIAAMGFIAYKQVSGQTTGNLEVVSAKRSEGRQLFHLCEGAVDSTIAGVQTGTTKFFEYFNTDRAHAKQVLVDVVIPVVTSREFACETAKADVAHVRKAATIPDKFMDDAAPVIDAQLARLKQIHANGDALAKALDANAPVDDLRTKLDTFRAAPP